MLSIVALGTLRVFSAITMLAAQQSGDTVVRAASAPRYPGVATLVPELSIGSATYTAEYSFTRVNDLLPMPDGSVIVVDVPIGAMSSRRTTGATTAVRWYDANGRFIRALGRFGQGPGEHVNPSGIARLPDGRILLRDATLHRVNVYSPAGEPVDTWRTGERENFTSSGADRLMVDRAGIVYLRAGSPLRPSPPGAPPEPGIEYLIRLRSDGTVIDSLVVPQLPHVTPMLAGRGLSVGVPFAPWTLWQWSPLGYFVTGVTSRYAIDLRIPPPAVGAPARPPKWEPGDPVVSIRRNAPPVAVVDAERTAHRAWVEAAMRRQEPAWTWSGPQIGRVKPAYRFFRVADDGRIWVAASVPAERRSPPPDARPHLQTSIPFQEPPIYDVLEPDGTYVGRVRLPDGMTLENMRGDTVWGTTKDADDVPTVRRYRIVWR